MFIPKLYDGRNRTFFLFSWEGIYQNIPSNPLETVPTALNRNGDFSDLRTGAGQPITIYDPLTTRLEGIPGYEIRSRTTAFPRIALISSREGCWTTFPFRTFRRMHRDFRTTAPVKVW